jgi:hypothetical protein
MDRSDVIAFVTVLLPTLTAGFAVHLYLLSSPAGPDGATRPPVPGSCTRHDLSISRENAGQKAHMTKRAMDIGLRIVFV